IVAERTLNPAHARVVRRVRDERRDIGYQRRRCPCAVAQLDDQRSGRIQPMQSIALDVVREVAVIGWSERDEGIAEKPCVRVHWEESAGSTSCGAPGGRLEKAANYERPY